MARRSTRISFCQPRTFLRKIDLKFYVTLRSISPYTHRVTNDVMFYRESLAVSKRKQGYDAKLSPTKRLSDHNS